MKKIALSAFVIIVFVAYIFYQKSGKSNDPITVPSSQNTSGSSKSSSSNNTSGNNQTSNAYKDGEYTGSVADAFYGNLQVKAVISGGKITDVQFLQYPNDQPTSVQINTQAMPSLKQEAIAAQSSQVDVVSGATQSSQAFQQSLASALLQAK